MVAMTWWPRQVGTLPTAFGFRATVWPHHLSAWVTSHHVSTGSAAARSGPALAGRWTRFNSNSLGKPFDSGVAWIRSLSRIGTEQHAVRAEPDVARQTHGIKAETL